MVEVDKVYWGHLTLNYNFPVRWCWSTMYTLAKKQLNYFHEALIYIYIAVAVLSNTTHPVMSHRPSSEVKSLYAKLNIIQMHN